MATISELNVRLGLLYKDFDSSLKKVERDLERSGRKFSQLGNDLALSISLPLAALGASAIKQAGEIESLKLAMTSTFAAAGRSASDATKEVEALRQAAMAPGLDFEQAVRGSVRLQNVGFSAEQSRETLVQLANAIALTGGTAQELDGVTRQFAQIVSKGRILQEDITILSENMPKISSLMKDAFGTANVERLREMGVTGEEFVQKITAAAAVLPRVEGGIKNALVNAAAEARNSLATLGETIVETFDVKGKLDAFAKALSGAVDWFKNLSDGTKETIIQIGLFATVLGPAIKVIGTIMSTGGAAISVIRGIGAAIIGVASGATTVTAAWQAMTLVMRASVIGVAIAAVTALYFAFNNLSESLSETASAKKEVDLVTKRSNASIAKEKSEVDLLIGVLNNEAVSRDSKLKAIERLQAISPKYFGQLKEENGLIVGLKESYESWVVSIKKAATAQAARERLVKIAEEELDIADAHEQKLKELANRQLEYANGSKNVQTSIGAYAGLGEQQKLNAAASRGTVVAIQQEEAAYKESAKALEARKTALANLISANEEVVNSTVNGTTEMTAAEKLAAEEAAKAGKKRAEVYKDVLASIDAVNKKQTTLGADFVGEKTTEIENGVEKLIEAGFGENSAPVQKLKGYLKSIREEIGKGFGGQNETQVKFGMNAGPLPSIPALSIPDQVLDVKAKLVFPQGPDAFDVPEQVIRLNSGPAMEAVKALQSLQSAAIADISAKQKVAADQNIAAAERERVATVTSIQTISQRIEALKQQRLTATTEVEQKQIDAHLAELERINAENQARKQAGESILNAVAQLGNNIIALNSAKATAEKAQLDEEYQYKLDAAKGNADQQEKIQKELAAKKAAIDKKRGKQSQQLAIGLAVIDTASGVLKALSSAPPPYNFILAALTAAAGAVQIATIKQQKFAKGGVITSPTVGLMGEYPGARNNPEIVTPERLMRSVFREESGGGKTQVYGVIRGSDILLSSERAANERGRTR